MFSLCFSTVPSSQALPRMFLAQNFSNVTLPYSWVLMATRGDLWSNIAGCCVTHIAVDGGYVYGIGTNQEVYKVSVNGGAWANIAGCCVTNIVVDGGYVYGIGTNQEVYKVSVNGGARANIAGCCVTNIAVGGGNVYGIGTNPRSLQGVGERRFMGQDCWLLCY